MKYTSPTTELRRQQIKKRKQQKAVGAILVCVAIAVGLLALFFLMPKKGETGDNSTILLPQASTAPEETPEANPEATPEANPEVTPEAKPEVTPEANPEATPEVTPEVKPEVTPPIEPAKATPQPTPKKKSWFSFKLPSFFSKTEKEGEAFPVTAFGRTIEEGATSIISLSPTATEALLSSPAQNTLIAVSEYCNKRGQTELMTVGTALIPQVDKIIQLAPQYLIMQTPLSERDKNKIEQSGIKILQISSPKNIEDLKEIYRSISALVVGKTKAQNASENIIYDIETKIKMYEFALKGVQKQRVVMLFNKFGMTATQDTLEGDFLKPFFDIANGGINYFAGTKEELVSTNPQVLIVPNTFSQEDVVAMGFGESEAVKNDRIYYVPIQDFENASPKMIKHLAEIANSVYGDAIKPVTIQDVYPQEKDTVQKK